MEFKFQGVTDAYQHMMQGIADRTIYTERMNSRVGEVLMIPEPVIVTFEDPKQRVLLNPKRDANPFFHVAEALWMLAGMNDIATPTYYSSNYAKQVDDGNGIANGAYGYRWREGRTLNLDFNTLLTEEPIQRVDQLSVLIEHLRAKPESRRAVLQMWNVHDDLLKIDSSKDVCCNLSCFFSIRETTPKGQIVEADKETYCLDMTVTNRSNDLIWGMLGANYVHFTILQEYVATALGIEVGKYRVMTNNLHVYKDVFEKQLERCDDECLRVKGIDYSADEFFQGCRKLPLFEKGEYVRFDTTVKELMKRRVPDKDGRVSNDWHRDLPYTPFLASVVLPMLSAFDCYKQGDVKTALEYLEGLSQKDWKLACRWWMDRRINKTKGYPVD